MAHNSGTPKPAPVTTVSDLLDILDDALHMGHDTHHSVKLHIITAPGTHPAREVHLVDLHTLELRTLLQHDGTCSNNTLTLGQVQHLLSRTDPDDPLQLWLRQGGGALDDSIIPITALGIVESMRPCLLLHVTAIPQG